MGTISSALSMAKGALDAEQAALNVVANNVANANTPGYTAENPNWQENPPIEVGGIQVGQGVTETGTTSKRNLVLQARLDQQQQLAAASSARLTALNNIQALFTPDSNSSSNSRAGDIGSDITSFFDSFSSLESDPMNNALREQVLSTGSTLAGNILSAASSLNGQTESLNQETSGIASQINALLTAIAQLNEQIQSTSPHTDAGILEDQRQQSISHLSELIGINQVKTQDNGLAITTTSGRVLVDEGKSFQLTTGNVNGATDLFLGGVDITSELGEGGGQLGGDLTARSVDIPAALNALDQLAYSISTSVNAQNSLGTDAYGATGTALNPLYIFNEPAAANGSAVNMKLIMTDPGEIAAAGAGAGTGDNSNAVAMANLAGQTITGLQTPINYYSNFVSKLGATVSEVQTENTAQNASVTQLQTQNDALSRVNLNDEAAAMSTIERSYQAASQIFTMLNTVMAAALNLGDQTAVA